MAVWQIGGLGPMLGQNLHFSAYAPEKNPYAIDRYAKETERLYRVLDKRLADRAFIAGDYSDITHSTTLHGRISPREGPSG